jgi:hypothetical protein
MRAINIIILFLITVFSISIPSMIFCEKIEGDINKDGIIDDKDRLLLERALGADRNDPDWVETCDLDGNGLIDFKDLGILKNNMGKKVVVPVSDKTDKTKKGEIKSVIIKFKIVEKTPLLQIDSFVLEKIESEYFAAEVLINKSGSVLDLKISKSTGYSPADVYIKSELKKWKFEPIVINQKAVEAWIYCRIELKKSDFQNPFFNDYK